DKLLGMAALKELDVITGEIKSTRTDPAYFRQGVAAALLDHILFVARERGYRRLSLAAGSVRAFDAAPPPYRKNGLDNGEGLGREGAWLSAAEPRDRIRPGLRGSARTLPQERLRQRRRFWWL